MCKNDNNTALIGNNSKQSWLQSNDQSFNFNNLITISIYLFVPEIEEGNRLGSHIFLINFPPTLIQASKMIRANAILHNTFQDCV